MIYKRKLYQDMLRWKLDAKGSTALLVKGARRVGKSTLVKNFAEQEYKSNIFIDFTTCKIEVRECRGSDIEG